MFLRGMTTGSVIGSRKRLQTVGPCRQAARSGAPARQFRLPCGGCFRFFLRIDSHPLRLQSRRSGRKPAELTHRSLTGLGASNRGALSRSISPRAGSPVWRRSRPRPWGCPGRGRIRRTSIFRYPGRRTRDRPRENRWPSRPDIRNSDSILYIGIHKSAYDRSFNPTIGSTALLRSPPPPG